MIRTYTELVRLPSFEERFEYLVLGGGVGDPTFGFDRYINQNFYHSHEWKSVRNYVISRDYGCNLGVPGFEIHESIVVHHINPMTADDIVHGEDWIVDPEFLITTDHETHNDIHYGNKRRPRPRYVERQSGDTKLW